MAHKPVDLKVGDNVIIDVNNPDNADVARTYEDSCGKVLTITRIFRSDDRYDNQLRHMVNDANGRQISDFYRHRLIKVSNGL